MFILKCVINSIFKDKYSFIIFFNSNLKYSVFERFYIKSFYKFINYSKLSEYKEEKNPIKSVFLVFNNKKRVIQVLVQFRPPLIILITLAYLSISFLNLVV